MTEPPVRLPPPEPKRARFGFLLRVGVFAVVTALAFYASAVIIYGVIGNQFVTATMSTFAAAAIGTAISLRIYERARLEDVGLGWNAASQRNLAIGLIGGAGAAIAVTLVPVLVRAADLVSVPGARTRFGSLFLASILLLFGAIGEEMMFRGYGFQVLAAETGAFATILPVSVLFSLMHASNPSVNLLAFINTFLWGVALGFSFLRSGDLWLPIGLHYGWNEALPLAGATLSGLKMEVTGYALHWRVGAIWSGGEYGPEGGLLTTLVVAALGFYLWKAPVHTQRPFLFRLRSEDQAS